MQKFLRNLMLAVAMLLPFASQAQNSWTVANGTDLHAMVPLDFYNCDGSGVRNAQMLYPASLLTDMTGQSLSAITFYHQNASATKTVSASTWYILMGTTTETDLSTGFSTVTLDTVYAGDLIVTGGVFTFEFDVPYIYNGGNLIVEIYTTGATGNWFGSANQGCYGVDAIGSTYSSMSSPNYTAFLPKTTFHKVPTCFDVTSLAVASATISTITLTWADTINSGATYSVYDMSDTTLLQSGITGTTYTATGLDANKAYTLGVVTDCGGGDITDPVIITARTACPATMALPYAEEFNGYSGFQSYPYNGPSIMPACWDYYSNGTNTAETTTSAYYGGVACYNGTGYGSMVSNNPYLYLPIQLTGSAVTSDTYLGYATARGDTRFAIFPALDQAINTVQISFDYKMSTAYSATGAAATLELGYVTDDTSTFVGMQSYQAVTTTQNVVELNLSTLAAAAPAGARLAFKFSGVHNGTYTSSYSNVACGIDNILVETLPNCSRITDLAINDSLTTSSSLTLTWADALNTNATYTVYDMEDTSVVATGISGTTYTVTDLAANTLYTFAVEANCSATDASTRALVSGRTACAAEALPFTESFDATLANDPCWRGSSTLYTDGVTPILGSITGWNYASSVSNGLAAGHYKVNIYGTSCKYWLVTPTIDFSEATSPMLTFDAAFTKYSGTAVADGDMTDDKFMILVSTNNGQTWTTASNINLSSLASLTYIPQYVDLSAYAGESVRVAFYAESTVSGGDNNLHIDNISIDESTGEICYPVSNLQVSNIASDGATLTWEGSAVSYTIALATTEDTTYTSTSDTSYIFENLDANTAYTVSVTAVCSNDSAAAISTSFRTLCDAEALPFTETFDATLANDPCWNGADVLYTDSVEVTLTANNKWTYSSSVSNGLPAGHYRVNIYGTGCKKWMITPTIDLTEATSPLLSFDAAFTKYSGTAVADGDITDDKFLILVSTNNGQTWTTASNINLSSLASLTYLTQYVDLSAYAGETVRVALYAESTVSGGDNNLHIDNISIDELVGDLCLPVSGLDVDDVTTDGATLIWNSTAAGSYTIIDMADSSFVATVADTTYDLTGLTAMTQYAYGVVANCSSNNSDTMVVVFNTACAAVELPYTEDFEETSAALGCWTVEDIASSTGIVEDGYTSYAYSGTRAFKFAYNTNPPQYLISPELSGADNGVVVSFMYKVGSATYPESFQLGYSTTTDDVEDFTWGTEQTNIVNLTYEQYIEYLPAGTKYVAFKYTANDQLSLYIDSVVFTPMSGSFCFPVADLAVDSVTATSVFLSWSDENNTGATYSIYGDEGNVIATNVAGTSYEVTGLTALTGYTFGVAANCSAEESSDVATIGAVTGCASTTCEINVYAEDAWGDGWNGAILEAKQNGLIVANYTMASQSQSSTRIYDTASITVCASAPVELQWFSGQYDYEIAFTIADYNGDSLYAVDSASNLIDGATFFNLTAPCGAVEADSVTIIINVDNSMMGTTSPAPGTYRVAVGESLVMAALSNAGFHNLYWIESATFMGTTFTDTLAYDTLNFFASPMMANATLNYTAYFEANPPVESTIDASEITYWVGTGSNQAVVAVNWSNGAYAWGVRFNGESITVQDALDSMAAYDYRFDYSADSYLNNITFDEGNLHLTGLPGSFWESKHNGISDMGLAQTLVNGDFEKWAEPAAGVITDSIYYGEEWGWYYIYTYTMSILPMWAPEPESISITFNVNDPTLGSIDPSGVRIFEVGDELTVTATPAEGCSFVSWTVTTAQGETMTLQRDMTSFTDTVEATWNGSTLTANFVRNQGIDEVESADFQAYSLNGKVIVKGVENMDVNVYDVTGRSVNNVAKAAETVEFTVPAAGVYMVKVGNAVKRVVVIR